MVGRKGWSPVAGGRGREEDKRIRENEKKPLSSPEEDKREARR